VPLDEAVDEARAALRAKTARLRWAATTAFDIETNASLLGIWTDFSQTFLLRPLALQPYRWWSAAL
jgi:hypothetical protein